MRSAVGLNEAAVTQKGMNVKPHEQRIVTVTTASSSASNSLLSWRLVYIGLMGHFLLNRLNRLEIFMKLRVIQGEITLVFKNKLGESTQSMWWKSADYKALFLKPIFVIHNFYSWFLKTCDFMLMNNKISAHNANFQLFDTTIAL